MIVSTKIAEMFRHPGFVNIDYLVENKLETRASRILNILNRDWRKWINPFSFKLGSVDDDPIFGYTQIGGSNLAAPTINFTFGCGYVCESPGALTKITQYFKVNVTAGNGKMALYDMSGNNPVNMLAESSPSAVGTSPAWIDFAISYGNLTAGKRYSLQGITDQIQNGYYNIGATKQGAYLWANSLAYPNFLNPYGTPDGYVNNKYSIYASYLSSSTLKVARTKIIGT